MGLSGKTNSVPKDAAGTQCYITLLTKIALKIRSVAGFMLSVMATLHSVILMEQIKIPKTAYFKNKWTCVSFKFRRLSYLRRCNDIIFSSFSIFSISVTQPNLLARVGQKFSLGRRLSQFLEKQFHFINSTLWSKKNRMNRWKSTNLIQQKAQVSS